MNSFFEGYLYTSWFLVTHPWWVGYLLCAAVFLLVLHEAGHYTAMRAFGIRTRYFSIGVGLWKLRGLRLRIPTKHGLLILNPIPFGGRVHGHYHHAPRQQRAVMYAAGGLTDLLVACMLRIFVWQFAPHLLVLKLLVGLEAFHGLANLSPLASDGQGILRSLLGRAA